MVNYEKLGVIFGIGGLVCSGCLYLKLKKTADTVNLAVNDLSSKTNIDVKESIVDAAIQRAVDREVDEMMVRVSRDVIKRISDDMSYQVKKAVDASYSDVTSSVSSEISKQVSRINMDKLKTDVTVKAKEAILEKFDGNLDDILSKFNSNLESISTIYESIAKTMAPKI